MLDITVILDNLEIEVVTSSDERAICECPFTHHEHDMTNPGFHIRPAKEQDEWIWICFKGCGQGVLIDLVRKLKGFSLSEAHHWLLLNGATVTSDQLLEQLAPPVSKSFRPMSEVFWEDYGSQDATKTSRYILDRGFTPTTLKAWGFRYDAEVPALVLPIYSLDQELVGVIRREVVDGAQSAKYLYSPGFEKKNHLFGANRYSTDTGEVVLVEGPLDCVWLHQCGVTSAVALLGAGCTTNQRKLIAKLGHTVTLALDNDYAGQQAMDYLENYLGQWFTVLRVTLPNDVKDVQELPAERVREIFHATA